MAKEAKALIQIMKNGPNGRPMVEIATDQKTSIENLGRLVQSNVTRNADILKKFGLKACPACVSGFDVSIRERFEHVLQVNLGN